MFEQSILLPEQDKKRWTFAASILVEVSAVSVLVLIPLIYTERLGLGWIQSVIPTAPLTRQQQPVLDSHVTRTSRAPRPNEFLMPNLNAHPRREILIDDQASLQPCPSCVESSLPPSDMTISRVGFDGSNRVLPPPLPPPTPKPAEVKKPPVETVAGPVKVSTGAQEAKIIRRVIPTYPDLAKRARVQGTVKLLGVISADGRIERLQVLSGHPLLIAAAVDAVKQWTYRPTLLNGQPVEVQAPIEVHFILSN